MDIKLFESIRQGSKAVNGNAYYEALTGRTTTSVAIAKDWLQALKDIVAEKADPLKVIAEFDARINAETAKGDLSDIYAHIRQQMPDTTDLGLVAANMASIEQWIKQDSSRRESADGKAAQASVNEAMGDGDSPVTAVKKPSKVNGSGDAPAIKKTAVNYTDKDALDAFNTNQNGTVGDEIVEYYDDDVYETDEGYYVDEDDNVFYVYENGDAFYVDEDYEPVEADDTYLGNIYTHEIFGEALEVVEKLNPDDQFSLDIGDHGIQKSYRNMVRDKACGEEPNDSDLHELRRSSYAARIGNMARLADKHGKARPDWHWGPHRRAPEKDLAPTPKYKPRIPDYGNGYAGGYAGSGWEGFRNEDDNTVDAWEYFFDEDRAVVYYDDDGRLWEASAEDAEAFIDAINEDINIYYNGDDGQGVGGMPPDDDGMDDGSGGMPPEDGGDPNVAGGGAPQGDMEVELINNGEGGTVSGVVVDVAGKHIEIGPDGVVNEQPAGGGGNPAAGGAQPPQQSKQGALQETLARSSRVLSTFFGEDNHNYTDVARRTPQTAVGGKFNKGINPTDPKALDIVNSGGDIDGSKNLKEAYELFEDEDGDVVFFDEIGDLYKAANEDAQRYFEYMGSVDADLYGDDEMDEAAGDYDHITVSRGLGGSLGSPKGDLSTAHFDVNSDAPNGKAMGESLFQNSLLFNNYIVGGAWKPGAVAEASMVNSGKVKDFPTPTTPKQFYDLANKDFNGDSVGAKDVVKPDQNPEPGKLSEDIKNHRVFNLMTRRDKSESWKAIEDIDAEHGVKPNKN